MKKKLLAMLLVACMAMGIVACGNTNNESTGATDGTVESSVDASTDTEPAGDPEKPFKGKTLQFWGLTDAEYRDPSKVNAGHYYFMLVALIEEWAAINECKVEYVNDFDQNTMLAAMNAGDTPDLVLIAATNFPLVANVGVIRAFSDAEYDAMADIVPQNFLDVYKFKGSSYGVNLPGAGVELLHYNKTIFETYGAKTPKEYFKEGNWTFETFEDAMESVTKDLDGDGKMDTYGIGASTLMRMIPYVTENEDGTLSSPIETDLIRDYLQMLYKGLNETGAISSAATNINAVANPRPAFHMGSMASHTPLYLSRKLGNGDQIEYVPVPVHSKDDPTRYNSYAMTYLAFPATCDEPEAALDLMMYMAKGASRYSADEADGLVACEYQFLENPTTELAKAFKAAHIVRQAEIKKTIADLNYDMDYFKMIQEAHVSGKPTSYKTYAGVGNYLLGTASGFTEAGSQPPATSIAALKPKIQAKLDTYNKLYVY